MQKKAPKRSKYFVAIRKDAMRKIHPIQALTVGGFAIHARTATYDFESQEASYHPGQVVPLTDEQVVKAWAQIRALRVQWQFMTEEGNPAGGRWKSEIVDPTSRIYEPMDREVDAETGRVLKEEVELEPYVLIKRHDDEEVPPAPPSVVKVEAALNAEATAEAINAAGIETEEEAADPRGFAADKRDMKTRKKQNQPADLTPPS